MFTPASLHKFKSRHISVPRRICSSRRNEREWVRPKSTNICVSVGQSSAGKLISAPICGPMEVRASLKRLWQLPSLTMLGRRKTAQVKTTATETILHDPRRTLLGCVSSVRLSSQLAEYAHDDPKVTPPARPNNPVKLTA